MNKKEKFFVPAFHGILNYNKKDAKKDKKDARKALTRILNINQERFKDIDK